MEAAPAARKGPWADRAPRGTRWAVIALFVAAALPVLVWMHPVGDYFTETDFYGGYAPGVKALWAHGLDPSRYAVVGPVYELLLGLLGRSGLDLFRLAQGLSLASTVATLALWSGWLEARFGRGAGWISALLMATNPTLFRYAYTASTDAPYLALASAAFVCLFPRRATLRTLVLGGALAALATLTRYTGIVLVGLGLLAPFVPGAADDPAPWHGRRVRALAAVLVGAMVVFGPWWAFTLTRGAPPTLRFYHNLAYEVYARARGITWDNYQRTLEKDFPTFQSVLTRDPGAVASRLAANTFEHLAQDARELWLLPLALLALVGLAGTLVARPRGAAPVIAFIALVYASLIPVFYANRYHLSLVPAAAALAALAVAGPGAWLVAGVGRRAGKGSRALLTALGVALVLASAAFAARASANDAQWLAGQVPANMPAMGRALRADWHGPGEPRLIARKPHLAYYANAVPVAFVPAENLEALAAYARTEHADYLFMSWPEAELRPPFAFLLVPAFAPPGLDLVSTEPNGHSTLYRIRPEFGRTLPDWYPREWTWRAAEGMVRVRPNDPDLWLATGEGRHARKDYDGAREAFGMALHMRPDWAAAEFDLANLDADQGRLDDARLGYARALAAGESSPRLLRAYAFVLARLGDRAGALDMMQRYVALTHDASMMPLLGAMTAPGAPGAATPGH